DHAGWLRRARQRSRSASRRRGCREDARHSLLQGRLEIAVAGGSGGARHLVEDVRRRRDPEVGFEQDALGLLARARVAAAEYAGDPLPQPHGSPCRRRHAHSLANAAIATTNSHHRSRIGTLASRPAAPPAWGCSTGVAGRHSSEYVSRATTPRSGPVGDSYEYTPGGSDSSARPVASKRSVSVRLVPAAPSRSDSTMTGRGLPRRARRAVRTTIAALSEGSARSDTAAAGASESHAIPASASASGDGPGGCTYQSPSWPRVVDQVRMAP